MKIREIEKYLSSLGVDNPKGEAYLILEKLFNESRASLLLCGDKDFSSPELDRLLSERKKRIPLQYLLGEWDFMGKTFYVTRDCLIPRADTEILVEKALKLVKAGADVADLCTGSGCIGISIAL